MKHIVAGYQGNLYTRTVGPNDTTVYMDQELASFDTESEALDFIAENEDQYWSDYQNSLHSDEEFPPL